MPGVDPKMLPRRDGFHDFFCTSPDAGPEDPTPGADQLPCVACVAQLGVEVGPSWPLPTDGPHAAVEPEVPTAPAIGPPMPCGGPHTEAEPEVPTAGAGPGGGSGDGTPALPAGEKGGGGGAGRRPDWDGPN